MEWAAAQCRYLTDRSEGPFAALEDDDLAREPVPGTKTAGWLIGHLVLTGDFGRRLCGLPPISPKAWRELFSPGTVPSHDRQVYPPMRDLTSTFFAVYRDFAANAPQAPADRLAAINPYEPARDAFPTAGDFVRYLLSGHLAWHLGQLSIWRAAARPAGRT